ncbi:cytochrome c-type biogenesis protein CcsB [Salsuginibacillus halophilus]|uniref:Cytochrome c-type biogenesis protein CcsB n=1 Tax=Salsuginibacillus halophilus TaxID=517424 RepID=A0A2P8HW94_9BACI|nr:c-type cytochrome biogenesis protein CcsB [Salsuginibacillus halophilus]PSL50444.1 cytochrome c-type biogenesis protein CcsB [Salsuginibacillus halophilus]
MAELSQNLLMVAFFCYFAATVLFAVSATGKNFKNSSGDYVNRWGTYGFIMSIIGVLFALGYFGFRWAAAGHAPVSNMFEYTVFLGIAIGIAFVILYAMYRSTILGLFAMPIIMLIIAYAAIFPQEVEPLIPALQTVWLEIHVLTTALGQGILGISFVAGLIYLVRTIDVSKDRKNKRTFWLEFIMYGLLSVLGFVIVTNAFNFAGYESEIEYAAPLEDGETYQDVMDYHLPPIFGPSEGEVMTEGAMAPLIELPEWLEAGDVNSVMWALLAGLVLYGLLRLVFRRRVSALLKPAVRKVDPEKVDELAYRAVAIGFPIFTLGGLIFAMIWAQIAWTRFWGWDPKEVWALITFLFYAGYLHLRLSRGWHGEPSAWLVVIGFMIIMFNLIFVNLVIAGLHSYA